MVRHERPIPFGHVSPGAGKAGLAAYLYVTEEQAVKMTS